MISLDRVIELLTWSRIRGKPAFGTMSLVDDAPSDGKRYGRKNAAWDETVDGVDGRTWLSGAGAPADGTGENGDFYLNTAASAWYGPKAAGTWAGTGPNSMIGPAGADGTNGTNGLDGADGSDGSDGKTWYSGAGAPSDATGVDGDFYLNTSTSAYYGPKAGGTWAGTGPTSLVGPAGADGADGADGAPGADGAAGADGRTWYSGAGAPSDGTGVNGDFYLDTTNDAYYGPKAAGSWSGTGPTSLIGPEGPAGLNGLEGEAGPNLVSTSTDCDITGLLKGTGTKVAAAATADLPITSGTDIGAALADGDEIAVYDLSATANKKSAVSRLWTYIWGKITGASTKAAPVDADSVPLVDSEDGSSAKRMTISVLKSLAGGSSASRGYIDGLTLSNAADADHDITIAAGVARDSTDAYTLALAAALTKQIDSGWAAGSAAGGLFSGSVGNSTWYHVFLIRNDSDGTIDAGFDTSVTAANRPAGYTAYRRIGSVLTNGSANILGFTQRGDQFSWTTVANDMEATPTTGFEDRTLSVPTGLVVWATLYSWYIYAGASGLYVYLCDYSGNARGGLENVANVNAITSEFRLMTNTSAKIKMYCENNVGTLAIRTTGWIDPRGKDA